MTTVMIFVLFVIGVILIVKGGDFFVDAASWLAEISRIPKFIIGATVVSVATTLPELFVSSIAAFNGKTELAVGNSVGSVIANIGLILAISVVCMPVAIKRSDLFLKCALLTGAAALLLVSTAGGHLNIFSSVLLVIIFMVFVWENIRKAKAVIAVDNAKISIKRSDVVVNTIKFIAGAAGIIIGADLIVENGSEIARFIGVSESIIGATVIAVGTSLPELITTITAVAKKQSSLSVGNILGANIIDLTLILPVCTLLSGGSLPVSAQSVSFDIPICLGITLVALVPTLLMGKFKRITGLILLIIYIAYIITICL